MRRIVAVYLPLLHLEVSSVSVERSGPPTALVVTTYGGTIKNERSIRGGTRIDEVNPAAFLEGVRPGQTVAAARSRCTELRMRVVLLSTVEAALSRLAEALLAFGATTAFELESSTVWVDVTGCAHLHANEKDPEGERILAGAIKAAVLALGHKSHLALAGGPVIARALARYSKTGPFVIASAGADAKALAPLPVQALPLSADVLSWLGALGIHTVGALAKLPRPALHRRLGEEGATVMALLQGDDPSPLTAYVPVTVPEERATLEYGSTSTETLLFVVKGLADRLSARLSGRAMATTRLELVLGLDRAFARETPRVTLDVPIATPLSLADDLLRILRTKIDAYVVPAPILEVALRATSLCEQRATTRHLFIPESKATRAMPRLFAELEAELGPGHVGVLSLTNRWTAQERSRLSPLGEAARILPPLGNPNRPRGALLSGAVEPTRLLREPLPLPFPDPPLHSPVKQSMVEWWTRAPGPRTFGHVWLAEFQSFAWVEVDERNGGALVRGWID